MGRERPGSGPWRLELGAFVVRVCTTSTVIKSHGQLTPQFFYTETEVRYIVYFFSHYIPSFYYNFHSSALYTETEFLFSLVIFYNLKNLSSGNSYTKKMRQWLC